MSDDGASAGDDAEADTPPVGGSDSPADPQASGRAVLAPTVGLVAGGLALATLFAPASGTDASVEGVPVAWLVRAAAAFVVVAFLVDRRGFVDRRPAGALAIVGSATVVVGEVLAMLDAVAVWPQPAGVPLAALFAGVALAMGVAEMRKLDDGALLQAARGTGVFTGVAVAGFVVGSIVAGVATGLVISLFDLSGVGYEYLLATVTSGIAFVAFAVLILPALGKDRSFLDLELPTLRQLGVGVLGLVALFVMANAVGLLLQFFDIPFATSQVQRRATEEGEPWFILWLIPLSFLAIAPGEEILFRNVVQKGLYDHFSRAGAVVVASLIFAALHGLQYASATPGATVVSLTQVFLLALILAAVYERTENVIVPILVHGAFNALTFASIYYQVLEDLQSMVL